MSGERCSFLDRQGRAVEKAATIIEWDDAAAEKAGFNHFMLKEIYEQPRALENTLRGRLLPLNRGVLERESTMTTEYLRSITGVHIVACGTSWHAGIVGKYQLERYAGLS